MEAFSVEQAKHIVAELWVKEILATHGHLLDTNLDELVFLLIEDGVI